MQVPYLRLDGPDPVVNQLVRFYRDSIEQGRLAAGQRLPTIRAVAAQTGATRTTVQDAYRRLQELGLVEATVGRGTTVTAGPPAQDDPFNPGARAAWRHLQAQAQLPLPDPGARLVANFSELLPDQDLFPVQEFRESLERVFERRGGELLCYGQPSGDTELRRLLASRDATEATTDRDPNEILITNGAQQGIDLVLRAFTRPGDAVVVAIPTYHHLFGLLKAHGLQIVPLRSGPDGIDLDDCAKALRRADVRLLYLMPTFHNPTGRTLDLETRRAVMELVQDSQVPVLEDEFELELRFRGEGLPSLRSMDPRGLTVTVRTFSKGLFPGVRLGWVHAPSAVLGPMAALKRYMDLETSPLLQAALLDFMQGGALDRYLEALRRGLGSRHDAAQQALADAMPGGSQWSAPEGGFALWVEGPETLDGLALARAAAAEGVLVSPGTLFYPDGDPGDVPGVRLSLSRVDETRIERGIQILGRCAHELVTATQSPQNPPLFL